tara:strand:- start:399 stop:701 length:303 start_codon:yes stop_codon:yes gene_type:complete
MSSDSNNQAINKVFILLSNLNDTTAQSFINYLSSLKELISSDEFNSLIYGDKTAIVNTDYKLVSEYNNRWSIDSFIRYQVKHKRGITVSTYTEIKKCYTN